jgi:hypothetical protein
MGLLGIHWTSLLLRLRQIGMLSISGTQILQLGNGAEAIVKVLPNHGKECNPYADSVRFNLFTISFTAFKPAVIELVLQSSVAAIKLARNDGLPRQIGN